MPQLTLEYTASVAPVPDLHQVLRELHEELPKVCPCDPLSIKSRVVRQEIFRVADSPEGAGFVHLEVAILEGRDEATRIQTSSRMVKLLKELFHEAFQRQPLSFSVEIREMEKASYAKVSSVGS